jgi:hypothetical protein
MKCKSHLLVTQLAFDILEDIDPQNPLLKARNIVSKESAEVDSYKDLEFVNVEGGISGHGRDNPHESSWSDWDDEASHVDPIRGGSLTAFNHYIDIRKGPGLFDDYDGYSYRKGSASKDQYETLKEFLKHSPEAEGLPGIFASLLLKAIGKYDKKIDEALNYWFNDEYIHVLGETGYKNCSPATERYSFPEEQGKYSSKNAELRDRFPLAESTGKRGKGVPYSLFMPVDNMARYWYEQYIKTGNPKHLGPVMHALQDASVPHHAACCNGNYHARYEADLAALIEGLVTDNSQIGSLGRIKSLIGSTAKRWINKKDPIPPTFISPEDVGNVSALKITPAFNWRIDQVVTWIACLAYQEYSQRYKGFKEGYSFDPANNFTQLLLYYSIAVCVLALSKASVKTPVFTASSSRQTASAGGRKKRQSERPLKLK